MSSLDLQKMNKNVKIILFIIIFVILIIPDFSPVRRFGDVSTYFMEIDSIAHDHEVFNSIMVFIMIYIGYIYLRFNNSDAVSLLIAALFFLLSTAYLYIHWVMADIYNMFLISLGLFLWLSYLNRIDNGIEDGRSHRFLYSSALICGLATFGLWVCNRLLLIYLIVYATLGVANGKEGAQASILRFSVSK